MNYQLTKRILICCLLAGALTACSGDSDGPMDGSVGGSVDGGVGDSGGGSGGSGGTGTGGGGADDDAGAEPTLIDDGTDSTTPTGILDLMWTVPDELKLCGDRACACADGLDNDGDGVADGFDAECTGPNDDDEGSFATGISGDNMDPKWQDCFFDGNSGAGDDGCRYHTDCLTGELSADHKNCTVSQECIDFCRQRTPNGCDCFGCCSIQLGDGSVRDVVITPDCEEENIDDCLSCVKDTDGCNNECADCELCPGKTVADLPAKCFTTPPPTDGGTPDGSTPGGSTPDGGTTPPPYTCDNNRSACASTADCGSGQYCSLGCCLLIPPD